MLSELSSKIPGIKSQNESSININDGETLTDDDNKNANDVINSFPDAIISKDAKNQLPALPEATLSPVQIPQSSPLDTFTSNDELLDSSEEEYVESDNENQSEIIVQDTNPSNNPQSDGGKLLRWSRMQEERRKRPRKSRVSLSEDTLSPGKRIRRQPLPKSPRRRSMSKTPRRNLQKRKEKINRNEKRRRRRRKIWI